MLRAQSRQLQLRRLSRRSSGPSDPPHPLLTLQYRAGNRVTGLLAQRALILAGGPVLPLAPRFRIQRKDTPPPPAPPAALVDAAAVALARKPEVANAVRLSKSVVGKLRQALLNARDLGDPALESQVSALDRRTRRALADAVLSRLQDQVTLQRAKKVGEIADRFEAGMTTRLPELAEAARVAELSEPQGLKSTEKRPQFPLIFKFIYLRLIVEQLKKPRTTQRTLGPDYSDPLGVAETDPLFPAIYYPALVAELKALGVGSDKKLREELGEAIADRALTHLAPYMRQRMGLTPDVVRKEYADFRSPAKENIEGGLAGYFACRAGMLNEFGSPSDVPATLAAIQQYYGSLVEAQFLQKEDPKPGGARTLVHPDLKAALDAAEKLIYTNGWETEVLASIRKYWSTNIRENRNNRSRLSEHSFGFAVDINPESNPNLAKFGRANWKYINELVGENIFYDDQGNPTEAVEAIRQSGGLSDPDQIMAAIEKIRSQSDLLVGVFDTEASLKIRLAEYLKRHGVSPGVFEDEAAQQMEELLTHAQQAATGPKKERAGHTKQVQDAIMFELWTRNAPAPTGISPFGKTLVETLARKVKSLDRLDLVEPVIIRQIQSPTKTPTRDVSQLGLGSLARTKLVRELEAMSPAERTQLAGQVVEELRQLLGRRKAEAGAGEMTAFVVRGFSLFQSTRKATGERIGTGKAPHQVASGGFANLNEKLVKALVLPEGGNLIWLGVHNQDMHHFELKQKPPLPTATAGTAPPSTSPAPRPTGP